MPQRTTRDRLGPEFAHEWRKDGWGQYCRMKRDLAECRSRVNLSRQIAKRNTEDRNFPPVPGVASGSARHNNRRRQGWGWRSRQELGAWYCCRAKDRMVGDGKPVEGNVAPIFTSSAPTAEVMLG